MSCCGSGYPNVHAVSLLILEYPQARRETTIAAMNELSATIAAGSLTSTLLWFGCVEEVRGGAGGSPDLPHLVDWRHGVYAAQLVMVSASSGSSVGAKATIPKQEDALCSNGCYDAQQAQLVRL